MSPSLSAELVHAITLRVQDPLRRSAAPKGEPVGVIDDPDLLGDMFDALTPSGSRAWNDVVAQMAAWGQNMPPVHVTRHADGSLSASSEDPHNYPLAPPATGAGFEALEAKVGHPIPNDLRQLYAIADGGFGPGLGYTPGFGPGLYSLECIGQTHDDLCRRGPDYTGRIEWPRHLLPLTDNFGPVAYDLERGVIVGFDEYWEDHGLTEEQAYGDLAPSLESWLREWLGQS